MPSCCADDVADSFSQIRSVNDDDIASAAIIFYELAEKVCLLELQNQILDVIARFMKEENWLFTSQDVTVIYETTQGGCGLQKFAARSVYWYYTEHNSSDDDNKPFWTTQAVQKLMLENAGFMTDFLNAGKDAGGYEHVKDPREDLSCDFDRHAEGKCYLLRGWISHRCI